MKATDLLRLGSSIGASLELVWPDPASGRWQQAPRAQQHSGLSWFFFVLNLPVLHRHWTSHTPWVLFTSPAQRGKALVKLVGALPRPPGWQGGLSHVCM